MSETSKTGTCHACGGTVSKSAKTCPHCGERKPYREVNNKPGFWTWVFIIFGFFFLMAQIGNMFVPVEERVARQNQPSGYGSEAEARAKCERAIRSSVNNPSTVDIQSFVGYGTDVTSDGTKRITQSFSAKNSFGAKQTYDAYCTIKSDGKFNIMIEEQGR